MLHAKNEQGILLRFFAISVATTVKTAAMSTTTATAPNKQASGSTENRGLHNKSPLKYVPFHYETSQIRRLFFLKRCMPKTNKAYCCGFLQFQWTTP
jgi:hypothetical protein